MSDPYYDPHPRIALDAPLALVGHPGAGVSRIARALCATTGLPFNDVARSAEASAGASRARVVLEEGAESLRGREGRAFRRALDRRPPGVISLDSWLLEDPALRAWGRDRCHWIAIRRPMAELLDRLRARHRSHPGAEPWFLVGPPRNVEELARFLEPREKALQALDTVYEAGGQHENEVARSVLAALDRLLPVTYLSR